MIEFLQPVEKNKNPKIIKLGGSIISHETKLIDFDYLREFRDLLKEKIIDGHKFVLILGGGQTMRKYADLAREEGKITNPTDIHWIGTAVNTLHAYIVRGFLGDELAETNVWKFDDKDKIHEMPFNKPVAVAGGFEAGKSSDWVALQIAKALKVNEVFDLKGVNGVYTSDPKVDKDATAIPNLSWDEYLKIIGNPEFHLPGANLPVDVIAAREAKLLGVKYYVLSARDLTNLDLALTSDEITGTIIE